MLCRENKQTRRSASSMMKSRRTSRLLGYRPLVYFWIAEYTDGTALPQFDVETGKENKFGEVDHQWLKRFGWYPFSVELAQRILDAEQIVVVPSKNRSYTTALGRGDRLVAHRTNSIKLRMRSGGIEHAETVYVLGIKGKKIFRINESGEIVT
jgi:hypothetical protein